jgi:hypothetical protein
MSAIWDAYQAELKARGLDKTPTEREIDLLREINTAAKIWAAMEKRMRK